MANNMKEKVYAAVKVIQRMPENGSFQPSHVLMLKFYTYYKQVMEGLQGFYLESCGQGFIWCSLACHRCVSQLAQPRGGPCSVGLGWCICRHVGSNRMLLTCGYGE